MRLPTIGIFDSGLGGLTGFRALRNLLPRHPLVYFGDTARVPYGTKTPSEILRYAEQDVRFLLSRSASAVLVACGTVSSVALRQLRERFDVPFTGVVEPAAKAAFKIASAKNGRILVLGTEATVRSDSFRSCLLSMDGSLSVRQQACPLFVPLAENLRTKRGDASAEAVAHQYLDPYVSFRPDVVVLGCTHFPLLSDIIEDVLPGPVRVSAGEEAAKEMAELFPEDGSSLSGRPGTDRFFTSGNAAAFARDASVYLDRPVRNARHVSIESFQEDV